MKSESDHAGVDLTSTEMAKKRLVAAVRLARRRLLLNLGLQRLVASVVAGVLLGGGALWLLSWLAALTAGGRLPTSLAAPRAFAAVLLAGATGGAVIGMVWLWRSVPSRWQVAIEIDARLQSQQRVASAWSVLQRGEPSCIGQALLVDAARTLSDSTLSHCFPIRQSLQRLLLIPLSLLTLVCLWWSLPDHSGSTSTSPTLTSTSSDQGPPVAGTEEQQQVRLAAEIALQRAEERRRAVSEAGWRESAKLLAELEQRLDAMQDPQLADRREALVTINELRSLIEERQQQLAASTAVRSALANLQRFGQTEGKLGASDQEDASGARVDADAGSDAKPDSDGPVSGSDPLERLRRLAEQIDPDQSATSTEDTSAAVNQPPAAPQPEQPGTGEAGGPAADSDVGDDPSSDVPIGSGDDALMQQLLEELRRLGQAVTDASGRGEPQSSAEGDPDGLRQLLESLKAAEEAAQQGERMETSQSLQQLLEQLSQMQQEAQESDQLAGMLQDLEQAKQQMQASPGDPAGLPVASADAAGQTGQRPGVGTDGASRPLLDHPSPEAADTAEFYQASGSRSAPTKPGLLAGRAMGDAERGESRQRVAERVGRTEPLSDLEAGETGWLPRSQRQQTQQYFDALRASPKP